jgi:hypothetical protein
MVQRGYNIRDQPDKPSEKVLLQSICLAPQPIYLVKLIATLTKWFYHDSESPAIVLEEYKLPFSLI